MRTICGTILAAVTMATCANAADVDFNFGWDFSPGAKRVRPDCHRYNERPKHLKVGF